MFSERFIQDAIFQKDRLLQILHDLGKEWRFDPTQDVLCQEVSFIAGRMDVFATFDGRQHLVIIEVKAGTAGPTEIQQLEGYIQNWRGLPCKAMQLRVGRDEDVLGILLAEDFGDLGKNLPNVELVTFALNRSFPFNPFRRTTTLPNSDELGPTPVRISQLWTLKDHEDYITDASVREEFRQVADCFLKPDDPRSTWRVQNPKGSHLGVRYKGMDVVCLFAKRRYFHVSYPAADGKPDFRTVVGSGERRPGAQNVINIQQLRYEVERILKEIDDKLARSIGAFHW